MKNKSLLRLLPLLIAVLFVLLAPKLMPVKPASQSNKQATVTQPAKPETVGNIETAFQGYDAQNPDELVEAARGLQDSITKQVTERAARQNWIAKLFHLSVAPPPGDTIRHAYVLERLTDPASGQFGDALQEYARLPKGTSYEAVALMRTAQIHDYLRRREAEGNSPGAAEAQQKMERGALERLGGQPATAKTLRRTPEVGPLKVESWTVVPARETALAQLDQYYRTYPLYRFFDVLVRISGGAKRNASYILAIILIAVLAKLITTPFSAAQFRSMREMQKVQPELKKLQAKYKGGDQKEFAKAQMQLFRDHNVNPMSSCLPMLVQTGILIYVYYGIRHFLYRFWDVSFLYLHNLANPDFMPGLMGFPGPLLILYAVSMFFTQKLISMPAATPEQAQQQRLMTFMMPIFLLFVMKGLPAAFILYWLLQNILMTGHQWLIMRPHRAALAAANGAPAPRAKPASPPPPASIRRLAQGTKASGKKRKRR